MFIIAVAYGLGPAMQYGMGAVRGLSMSDRLVCRDTDDVTYHDGVLVVLRCVRRVCSV